MSRLEDPETVADSHLSTIVAMAVWKKPGAAQGSFQIQGVGGFTNSQADSAKILGACTAWLESLDEVWRKGANCARLDGDAQEWSQ